MRNTEAIKKWMKDNRWRLCDIRRALGLVHHTQIWETIKGKRSDRRTLKWFLKHGCPVEYLGLPNDIDPQEILKEAA